MNERIITIILIIASLALIGVGFLLYPVINPCKEINAIDVKKYTDEIKDNISTANDSTLDAITVDFLSSHGLK